MVARQRPGEHSPRQTRGLFASARNLGEDDRRRAEHLFDVVRRDAGALKQTFYDVGLALLEIDRRGLYEALEYPTFEAAVQAETRMDAATAKQLVAIADAGSREAAERKGWPTAKPTPTRKRKA